MLCGAWATPDDLPENWRDNASDAQWERWLMLASEILFTLSGQQWSGAGCMYVADLRGRPPAQGSGAYPYYRTWGLAPSGPGYWWWNSMVGFAWFPQYLGPMPMPYAVKLPHDQITEVEQVTINGELFTAWMLSPGGWLERTDGDRWQKAFDDTQVTYTYGTPPPEGGVTAATQLANEIRLYECGDNSCQLPKRVTSITRQGMTIAVIDPMNFFKIGRTGIYAVDLWLVSVNPSSRMRRARVFSPDLPRAQ
jgi:hypothetical protein